MLRLLFSILFSLSLSSNALGQKNKIDAILAAEHKAGHFNGTMLVVNDGKVVARASKGFANLQFAVPIDKNTRLPIASMTKLLTAILTLQLLEKEQLKLGDKASQYIAGLPTNCQNITILDLLTHYSGLKNEPAQAYSSPYSTAEFLNKFVAAKESSSRPTFNYNNVDYIVLTHLLEVVSKKTYPQLLHDNIFKPLDMVNSGMVVEGTVIPGLAYGYHNYSFGNSKKAEPLKNDPLIYLSNYAGAGGGYSTPDDLYKLVQSLKANKLLTAETTAKLLTAPQTNSFIEYARGIPTIGFYYNGKTFPGPVLERRGSINGFNSVLLADKDFRKIVILLTNTDTGDLELIGDKIYAEIQ
ncbi:serine hydrolase domain-containing protein [Hymenobacter sp. B1770]|uniref:serine hydrolase domain-containing protein n=1 Tax=Hymenobacter sp. B1770 TaxID=1718788 RepID=UPI003CF868C4